jgi:hypothetical protein
MLDLSLPYRDLGRSAFPTRRTDSKVCFSKTPTPNPAFTETLGKLSQAAKHNWLNGDPFSCSGPIGTGGVFPLFFSVSAGGNEM